MKSREGFIHYLYRCFPRDGLIHYIFYNPLFPLRKHKLETRSSCNNMFCGNDRNFTS